MQTTNTDVIKGSELPATDIKICVIGLGYVGLPLAVLFSKKYPVVGFDINHKRVERITQCVDDCNEVDPERLRQALGYAADDMTGRGRPSPQSADATRSPGLVCTSDIERIRDCNVYIVAVPTPVDAYNNPDLRPLEGASRTVGQVIKPGDYVIYESTVYPGTTEEVCVPEIERVSGLKLNQDFYVGYSPERINPGDRKNTVENIVKITSGSTPEAADFIDRLYASVLVNGTHRAPSIQVAEAAKVLENTQRDLNIAFINEAAKIFNVLGINTHDVLEAAGTKWNFLKFHPGLVGGHCIGVDPYYLIQRAMAKGYRPKLLIEARRINDTMGVYVASRITEELNRRHFTVHRSSVLILGLSFKANCPDLRNTKSYDVYRAMKSYTDHVTVYDPVSDPELAEREYGLKDVNILDPNARYDAIVQCVNHSDFAQLDLRSMLNPGGFVFYVTEPSDPVTPYIAL